MSGYNKNKHYFHLRSHIFPAYIILHHTHWERKFTSCVRPTSKQLANMLSTSWGEMDRCGNWMSETASLKPRRSSSDQKTQFINLTVAFWTKDQEEKSGSHCTRRYFKRTRARQRLQLFRERAPLSSKHVECFLLFDASPPGLLFSLSFHVDFIPRVYSSSIVAVVLSLLTRHSSKYLCSFKSTSLFPLKSDFAFRSDSCNNVFSESGSLTFGDLGRITYSESKAFSSSHEAHLYRTEKTKQGI
jgi:hypothetical protein